MQLEALNSYTWPTDGFPVAGLAIRVDNLAARLGLVVHAWTVDGLGPARGFGVRLPSGRVVLFEELEYAVRYQGAPGSTVYMDAAELAALGSEVLVSEVLEALELTESNLAFVADSAAEEVAAALWARALAARSSRETK